MRFLNTITNNYDHYDTAGDDYEYDDDGDDHDHEEDHDYS